MRTPLIIFVFMIIVVILSGFGVILPSLYAVETLQNELAQALQELPLILLRALELQASHRAEYLRKQLSISLGGTVDDDLDGDNGSQNGEAHGEEHDGAPESTPDGTPAFGCCL